MAVPPELSMRDSVKAKSLALSVVTPPSSAARAALAAPHATITPAAAAANLRDQVLLYVDIAGASLQREGQARTHGSAPPRWRAPSRSVPFCQRRAAALADSAPAPITAR
jgi:hypothetical protein